MPYAAAPDGTSIHYSLDGPQDAPVLMLSNSLGVGLGMWDPQVSALSGFRLLRYDTRGHGLSGVPAGEYRLEKLGADALALLDALGVERADFCGASMGGAIGQWLAVNAPDRVGRLVLAGTAAIFGTPDMWSQRMATALRDGMGALAPAVLDRWFTAGFREREPAAVKHVEAMLLACPTVGYAGCCAALRDIDLRADLGRIAAPTLVIGGVHDQAAPPERVRELADGIAGASLTMLDSAHLPNIEMAGAFNAAIAAFLEPGRR